MANNDLLIGDRPPLKGTEGINNNRGHDCMDAGGRAKQEARAETPI